MNTQIKLIKSLNNNSEKLAYLVTPEYDGKLYEGEVICIGGVWIEVIKILFDFYTYYDCITRAIIKDVESPGLIPIDNPWR